jgi:hypothetical protein
MAYYGDSLGRFLNNEEEGFWKEAVMALLKYEPGTWNETSGRIFGVREQIRTEHFRNASLKLYLKRL